MNSVIEEIKKEKYQSLESKKSREYSEEGKFFF